MDNTKEIKFIGYNMNGERFERTISGIYDREVTDLETKLTKMDMLRYNFICLQEPPSDKLYKVKKITLSLITDGVFHNMVILLDGTAYVMNPALVTLLIQSVQREGNEKKSIAAHDYADTCDSRKRMRCFHSSASTTSNSIGRNRQIESRIVMQWLLMYSTRDMIHGYISDMKISRKELSSRTWLMRHSIYGGVLTPSCMAVSMCSIIWTKTSSVHTILQDCLMIWQGDFKGR